MDQRVADCNYINFTIFKDMLPLMEGLPGGGQPRAPQARTAFSSPMFSVRYSIQWVSRTPGAPVRDAMPMYPPPGAGTARGRPAR